MNANQKKYELIEKLVMTEDESILNQVKAILEGNETQFWDSLNPKLKESIHRGIAQSKKGMGISHAKVMRQFRSRLSK